MYVDGECVSPQNGYLIRRAPGHTHYDYGQSLAFQPCGGENLTKHHTTVTTSQTDSPLPKGCIQQYHFLSSMKKLYPWDFEVHVCNNNGFLLAKQRSFSNLYMLLLVLVSFLTSIVSCIPVTAAELVGRSLLYWT